MRKIIVFLFMLFAGCAAEAPQRPEVPQRIISLAPAITETLFALGAGERVVGVTNYCNYPEAAKKLPNIGDFAMIDFEKVISFKPDLVIATTDGNPREAIEKIQSLGIATRVVHGKSFANLLASVSAIGEAIGSEEEAKKLLSGLRRQWNSVGPKTLLLYGVDPLVAAGEGSLGNELIQRAGGSNIFGDSGKTYVTTNHEAIISLAPEVIVQVAMGAESNDRARQYWSRWSAIPAVRDGRVHVLDPDLVTRPGPRIVEALKLLSEVIHPERK